MPEISALSAVTSIDGRYHSVTRPLQNYFSEHAFFKYRLRVEIDYFIQLSTSHIIRKLTIKEHALLKKLFEDFDHKEAVKIKEYEQKTQHDIKALEYYLHNKLGKTSLHDVLHFFHFGLTSDDINNIAQALALSDMHFTVLLPTIQTVSEQLRLLVETYAQSVFIARTHGQLAIPTTFGKEMAVFYKRLKRQIELVQSFKFDAKLTSAVGNFNALSKLYPKIDWLSLSSDFIHHFKLQPVLTTTQILPYDNWNRYFQIISQINSILASLCQDIWYYASVELVHLKIDKHQVGSSTMPQKINPWKFENAEGNLLLANSLLAFYIQKLSSSRLQRDLTDSTIKRSFGEAFGHVVTAYDSLIHAIPQISFNTPQASFELDSHYEVLMELVQLYLRKIGKQDGYEQVRSAVQGKKLTQSAYKEIINTLDITQKEKDFIINITPHTYIGIADKIIQKSL